MGHLTDLSRQMLDMYKHDYQQAAAVPTVDSTVEYHSDHLPSFFFPLISFVGSSGLEILSFEES
jgi:hypothetical protein